MTLITLYKHFGGYIANDDITGLKVYYRGLFNDCHNLNITSSLMPEKLHNPAVYNLLAIKYEKAYKLGILFHFDILLDVNELDIKCYEFCRILGILLDNAIEATSECDDKIIRFELRKDRLNNRNLVIIENTYLENNVDTGKIFQKGFSSKPNNTGLGLWEVKRILKKNSNLNLSTSKDGEYFKQQLEIYIPKKEMSLV